jgi:type IV secretory pathway VirB2 component (pilin)
MYTVPVVLAIVIVFLAALIFWGAFSEQKRGSAR